VPGHNFQVSIQNQRPCIVFTASLRGTVEGWALYCEKVAAFDMGLAVENEDAIPPVTKEIAVHRQLSYLQYRLLRTVRCIVDPGYHYPGLTPALPNGWSRQDVVDFMTDNTLEIIPFIESEADRYVQLPGQAVSYYIGALVYEENRARAEAELGADFDLREWHDVQLRYMVQSVDNINALTDFYIEQKKAGTFNQVWPPITRQPQKPVWSNINFPQSQFVNLTTRDVDGNVANKTVEVDLDPEQVKKAKRECMKIIREFEKKLISREFSNSLPEEIKNLLNK
jgi:hypothetical protein